MLSRLIIALCVWLAVCAVATLFALVVALDVLYRAVLVCDLTALVLAVVFWGYVFRRAQTQAADAPEVAP